jgi:serine-type D-Ala-D-Ala carboxypeptidase
MSAAKLDRLDDLVRGCIRARTYSACVFVVARDGETVRRGAFGHLDRRSAARPTRLDSVFDVMSITKSVATASTAMRLAEEGTLSLDTKLASLFEQFRDDRRKSRIRIRDLLTMSSGLTAVEPSFDRKSGPRALRKLLLSQPADLERGTRIVYSDVGYRTLGFALEAASSLRVDKLARREVFRPAGLLDTKYTPSAALRLRCAETNYSEWRRRRLVGETVDDMDYALGGILGHAGLFSTAHDLSAFLQMILNGGRTGPGTRVLEGKTVKLMTTDQVRDIPVDRKPSNIVNASGSMMRGLGFELKLDVQNTYMGELFSRRAFGKYGGTGCFMAADPESGLSAVLLTNTPVALSPDEPGWDTGGWFKKQRVVEFFDGVNSALA